MAEQRLDRRLAAILVADVVGYARLMEADELATRARLNVLRAEVIDPRISEHGGRVVKEMGDGLLVEFGSAVDAVECAAATQRMIARHNADLPEALRLEFRMGINIGDVIVDGEDLHGSTVNIAARVEGLAEPGGIYVSRTVFNHVKGKVELSFEDAGQHQVKNIAEPVFLYRVLIDAAPNARPRVRHWGRRWQAVAAVAIAAVLAAGAAGYWASGLPPTAGGLAAGPTLPTGPTIAVLPFDNLSGDPRQDYFAEGLAEDLIAALGRFPDLAVLARNATAPFKGHTTTAQEIGRALGARYLLTGSARGDGGNLRVSVQLVNAVTGQHLWSRRYDRTYESVFEVQDDIARNVAGALAIQLKQAEQGRTANKPTRNLEAYDYVLRGWSLLHKNERSEIFQAREMFENAVQLDPNYADALAGLGFAHRLLGEQGHVEFAAESLERAEALALEALSIEPDNVEARGILASVHRHRGEYELAAIQLQRALAANPSDAQSMKEFGSVHVWFGDEQKAIEWLEAARQLDPNMEARVLGELARAYYLAGRYQDAVVTAAEALERNPDLPAAFIARAAAYAQLERHEQAAEAVRELLRVRPFFTIDLYAQLSNDPNDAALFTDGLRKAGLPQSRQPD